MQTTKYVVSDRAGDPGISPNPGAPRLMQGEVVLKKDDTPSSGKQEAATACGKSAAASAAPSLGILPVLGWLCCFAAVLWVCSVSSPFLANALVLDGWRFWASLVLGLLPFAFVAGVMIFALSRFRRIPGVEQFTEAAFADDPDELKDRLVVRYLRHFDDPLRYAIVNGFVAESDATDDVPVVDCLKRLKGELPANCSGSDGWLHLFKDFQRMQDERAKEIAANTWKLVAIKTAASPWKIVDMLAVVYNSTAMLVKIAKVYNRRTSRRESLRLAFRWIVNIYVAGEMGEMAQGAADWAAANDFISAACKPLASFAGKLAEGGANALLVHRLGRRAIEYFRALR